MNYEELGKDIGRLVDQKNEAYGDSFSKSQKFLQILYPERIEPEDYSDVLVLARIFDKMMRIANKKEAFDENPYKDIAGYGLLGTTLETEPERTTNPENYEQADSWENPVG